MAPLSMRQVETLQALVNRIIPPDDHPGGWEAGVGDYLFRQFEGDLKPLIDDYARGLDSLDAEARVVYSVGFAGLPEDQQDALLREVEIGRVTTRWSVDPAAFFRMAVDHCAEGYYSDPGSGGNHDGASWKLIGFEVTG